MSLRTQRGRQERCIDKREEKIRTEGEEKNEKEHDLGRTMVYDVEPCCNKKIWHGQLSSAVLKTHSELSPPAAASSPQRFLLRPTYYNSDAKIQMKTTRKTKHYAETYIPVRTSMPGASRYT